MNKKSVSFVKSNICVLVFLSALSTPLLAQNAPQEINPEKLPTAASVEKSSTTIEGIPPLPRPKPELKIWTPAEIKKAGEKCGAILEKWKFEAKQLPPLMGFEGCGDPAPLLVSQIFVDMGERTVPVEISPAATLNCKMADKLAHWITRTVQPVSKEYFTSPVKKIHNISSYNCRKRYNAIKGKMSEHAFANALDISAFSLMDGTKISLLKNWEKEKPIESKTANPATNTPQEIAKPASAPQTEAVKAPYKESAESIFLKKIHKGACADFSTVLGPESNAAHADHFHLDLGRNGRYQICE